MKGEIEVDLNIYEDCKWCRGCGCSNCYYDGVTITEFGEQLQRLLRATLEEYLDRKGD